MEKLNPVRPMGRIILLIILTALGLLSAGYGLFIAGVQSGSGFFLSWFLIGGILILLALGLHFDWIGRIPKILRACFGLVLIIAAIILTINFSFILKDYNDRGEKGLDYVIVLGAQVRSSGPSAILKYRLDTAASYLEENPDTLCIVTGGKGYNEPVAEGRAMKDYLILKGISPAKITAETASRNTTENLQNSRSLLKSGYENVGIVTSNFHVYRGIRLAEKQGYKNVSGISAPVPKGYALNNILRETLAIAKDRLAGNI